MGTDTAFRSFFTWFGACSSSRSRCSGRLSALEMRVAAAATQAARFASRELHGTRP